MDASYVQTSFLGGEFSPYAQGRMDHQKYRTGLNKCRNIIPVEEGGATRRPGTRTAATTRAGAPARLIPFNFTQSNAYVMELTDSHLRFFSGYSLVFTYDLQTVTNVAAGGDSGAVFTTQSAHGWAAGDVVQFGFPDASTPDVALVLRNYQFKIESVTATTFEVRDPIGSPSNPVLFSGLNWQTGTPMTVQRVLDLSTSYTQAMLPDIRAVQGLNGGTNTLVLLHSKLKPYSLTSTNPPLPTFTLAAAAFTDGPYYDPVTDGTVITPSGTSGSVTLTVSGGSTRFAASDVGRFVRLLSEPAAWAVGTAYTTGQAVKYNGSYYLATANSTGKQPDINLNYWYVSTAPTTYTWSWAQITAYTSATQVTAAIKGGNLVNTLGMSTWRLGLYSDTTGWPTVGCYHEGRLWLGGVVGNRFDASVSNDIFNFSPTSADGTVADNNAIAYVFNSKSVNQIRWMVPDHQGIQMGTQASEWLVRASGNGDPLTPTSIQAASVSNYGGAFVEPIRVPFATMFVERNNRKLYEYMADVYSGKFSGHNMTEFGKHLTGSGIKQLAYQQEVTPIVWVLMNDGTLAGLSYRRESLFMTEQPSFAGWHTHDLGTGRKIESIAVGPSVDGNMDTLTLATYDSSTGLRWVELLTDIFEPSSTIQNAWFTDGATTPTGAKYIAGSPNVLRFYGMRYVAGATVSAFVGGVDCGDFTVAANGTIDVPIDNGGLLTSTLLSTLNSATLYGSRACAVNTLATTHTVQSLQAYVGAATKGANVCLVDYARARVLVLTEGQSTGVISSFNIESGVETAYSQASIYGAGDNRWIQTPMCLGHDGNIYSVAYSSNSTPYQRIDGGTIKVLETAGISSSNTTVTANEISFPANMAPASVGTRFGLKYFCVAPSLNYAKINVVEMTPGTTQFAGHSFAIDEARGYSVGTEPGTGIVYTLGRPDVSLPTTTPFGIYKTVIKESASGYGLINWSSTPNGNITTTKIGTVSPAQVDATWSHFSAITAPAYDHSDGHLMVFVQTTDAVTNKQYLVKVNAATAAVMWKIATDSIPAYGIYNMGHSYIAYGQYSFLSAAPEAGGAKYCYNVDTINGTATVVNVYGLSSSSVVWDSRYGSVFNFGDFTQVVGSSPTLLNSSPTSWGSSWSRLYINTTYATGYMQYTIPACIGTTYTSQGQLLRPVAPDQTGARNGPGFAKTRRSHQFGVLLNNSQGVSFGSDFTNLYPAHFVDASNTAYANNVLYSGMWWNVLEDSYSWDSMPTWQVTRPYPCTMLAYGAFLQTQDR